MPIDDVPLLSYALANKTVNSSYSMTASSDDVYIGLISGDPYTSQEQKHRDLYEINHTDWQAVSFQGMYSSSACHLAMHSDWIAQHGYVVDGIVNLNLPEQGITGPFRITSIKHILPQKKPETDPDDGYEWKPVTGLFIHQSDQVHNVSFDNNATLGVTARHPVFSTTYNDWRPAGELEVGEMVLTYHGEVVVTSATKKEEEATVYNLEVKDLHNFLVNASGVVVHNSCARTILGKNLYDDLLAELKIDGLSTREAKEWLEDLASAGLKDEVLETGEAVTRGLAQTIRTAAREFGEEILVDLVAEIAMAGFSGATAQNSVSEVTFDIQTDDGTFTTISDQVVMDNLGNLHLGEAKYSTKDKDWIADYVQASTENQIDFYEALEDGKIISITPRGSSNKLGVIGLTPNQPFAPNKIKSIHLMGSNKASKTIKTILRLF